MTPWATPADAPLYWADAADVPEAVLSDLLDAAQDACAEYAPALLDTDPPPVRYKIATVYQAREVWAAAKRDGDLIGSDPYPIRARPLTDAVKQLLRPHSGYPRTG